MLVTRGWWWVNWGDDDHVVKVSLMQNEEASLFEISFILRDPLYTTGSVVNNAVLYTNRFSERKDIKFCYHKKREQKETFGMDIFIALLCILDICSFYILIVSQ